MNIVSKLIVCVIPLLLIAGCSDSETDEIPQLSDQNRIDFVAGCTNGGAQEKICACLYDGLTSKYTSDEMNARSEKGMPSQEDIDEMRTIIEDCR